jgi:hypothetical protein
MYNSGNSSKNVRGSEIVDGTIEAADLATAVNNDIADGVAGKATADLALPKAGGAMTGAITTDSTFDGRDVATDGAALDVLDLAINSAANAEAITIDASEVVTFVNPTNGINAVGGGQSWTDVSASRVKGTNYTNSTGKPIVINISSNASAGAINRIFIYVDAVRIVNQRIKVSELSYQLSSSVIVPNGSVYYLESSTETTVSIWQELR